MKLTTALAFGGDPNAFDFDVSGDFVLESAAPSNSSQVPPGSMLLVSSIREPHIESRVAGSDAGVRRSQPNSVGPAVHLPFRLGR